MKKRSFCKSCDIEISSTETDRLANEAHEWEKKGGKIGEERARASQNYGDVRNQLYPEAFAGLSTLHLEVLTLTGLFSFDGDEAGKPAKREQRHPCGLLNRGETTSGEEHFKARGNRGSSGPPTRKVNL